MGDFIHPPAGNAPVAIYEDGGGLVDQYRDAAWQYNMTGRQVKILGSCRSACLLALSVKNVCVGSNAIVKAHMAYERDTHVLRADVTARMLNELPEAIYGRLNGNITRSYNSRATLTYRELISLGVRKCYSQVFAKDTPYVTLATKPKTGETINAH